MVARAKIDSNETELAFAEEVLGAPGTLSSPTWYPLEPNEYDDFGGEYTLLARRPINSSRQRKKGSIVDLDASGGFNQDLTNTNSQRLLQGFMYASFREKANSVFTGVTSTGFSVADETDFIAGMLLFVSGSSVAANNGLKIVTGVDDTPHEVLVSGLAVDASPAAGATIVCVGHVMGATGDVDVIETGNFATYTSTTLDFTTLGLIPGEWFFVGGDGATLKFTNAGNNGFKRVFSVAAHALVVDASPVAMVVENQTTLTPYFFFGRVLKNELADLQVRRSYNLERKLGRPETGSVNQQAEYIIGAFGDELTMNIDQADKINVDYSFVAINEEKIAYTTGIKAGTRATIFEADAYNTSTDFNALRLSIYNGTDEAPSPLFAHLLELKVNIKNNVSVNKAVAILGGFDVTLGMFEVSAELTAYFSTVDAVAAVKNNSNVGMFAAIAKNNAGVVWDLPLGALGDGRLTVEIDEPIKLPVTMDAATAVALNPNCDYTCLWCFFDYLPALAEA